MKLVAKQYSPRHGFEFSSIPTVKGSIYGGSIVAHYPEEYGPILDCVYEMADDISNGNGWTLDKAIETVLKDENWRILPTHRKIIKEKLERN